MNSVAEMSLPVSIEWLLPDGTVANTQGKITVGDVMTINLTLISSPAEQTCGISPNYVSISSLSMTFDIIKNSDGGVYFCQAAIHVPWII